jgi:hypothetical protein
VGRAEATLAQELEDSEPERQQLLLHFGQQDIEIVKGHVGCVRDRGGAQLKDAIEVGRRSRTSRKDGAAE